MEFTDVRGLAADAIGEPGARTFLLQLYGDWGRHTYLLEKGQVAALAAGADQLIREAEVQVDTGLEAPILIDEIPRFRVAQLGLGFDQAAGVALLTVSSVADADEEVLYRMSLDVLAAAARQGAVAVAGGRPACPDCGLAMDPTGHACPKTNGDLRNHQP